MRALAAAAVFLFGIPASPALGAGSGPYLSIEGGLTIPRHLHGDVSVDAVGIPYVCLPGKSECEQVPEHFTRTNAIRAQLNRGVDVDAIAGYDLGVIRLEAELGWKRMKAAGLGVDQPFLDYLSAILQRPLNPLVPGAPGQPALVSADFRTNTKVSAKSAMINAVADLYGIDGLSFYAGAGLGRVWARALSQRDSSWAAQGIAGVAKSVAPGVQIGVKYRYFESARLTFSGDPQTFVGNTYIMYAGGLQFPEQDSATVTPRFHGRFKSHSFLATLTIQLLNRR